MNKQEKYLTPPPNTQSLAVTKTTLPSFEEIISETETSEKENKLMVLLNQRPPDHWIKTNNGVKYLPIERVRYIANRIYAGKWSTSLLFPPFILANSVVCCVRVSVVNPVTNEIETNDGVGAVPIQLEKGSSPTDWTQIKPYAIQMNTPAAMSHAESNAFARFGIFFGRGLNGNEDINYLALLKKETSFEDLKILFEEKKKVIPETKRKRYEEILERNETKSFVAMERELKSI